MTSFDAFTLAKPLYRALRQAGYETPTPIQQKAIPHAMAGRDVLGLAQTGTGKTAAFLLPLLDRIVRTPQASPGQMGVRALVLAPTRELAAQIIDSAKALGRFTEVNTALVVGGAPIGKQVRRLRFGVDLLVATPGRLIDLMERRAVDLSRLEVLVLDEADQMLDLGFIKPLRRIVSETPASRQTLFFSATFPKEVAGLARDFLQNPERVEAAPPASVADRVVQQAAFIKATDKPNLLSQWLRDMPVERAIVFTRTKRGAERVSKRLQADEIAADAIHGDKTQGQRTRALKAFRDGQCRILVATDVAARGIDIPGVSHVFNYELPNVPEQYVHRIGRTARAGAEGLAISFVAPDERAFLKDIEKLTGQRLDLAVLPEGYDNIRPMERDAGAPPRGPAKKRNGPRRPPFGQGKKPFAANGEGRPAHAKRPRRKPAEARA